MPIPKSKPTFIPPENATRPAALTVESNDPIWKALRRRGGEHDLVEGLRQTLTELGFDVVVASKEEAPRLVRERTFERIFGDGSVPLIPDYDARHEPTGPRVEDLGDGTARVQIDQVVPWSLAVELVDALAAHAPEKPRRHS